MQIHDLTKPVGRLMPRTDERNLTGNCPEVHPLDSYLSGERPLDSYLPGERLASPLSGEILLELYLYAYATCLLPFELEFTDVLL